MTTAALERSDQQAWHKLSRRMLAIHPVQEFIRYLPALFGLLIAGHSSGHGALWSLIGLGVPILIGLLRWFTTSYRITGDQVQVRRGVLRRQVLAVPLDRVRTVDLTAHAMHRALGLTRVTIGTGRSDRRKSEGVLLDALTRADAEHLRDRLLHRTPVAAPEQAPETLLAQTDPSWLRYGPFTLSGFVTIGAIAAVLSRVFGESGTNPRRIGFIRAILDQLDAVPLGVAVLEVVAVILLAVAVASTAGYILTFWNFRLTRPTGGTLHVTRGLLTSRATTIEERRLRGAEFSEPLLLRWVGGARCLAIATGLRVGRGAERGGSVLLPPGPRSVAAQVAGSVLRTDEPMTVALHRHPRAALRRRLVRAFGGAALVIAVLAIAVQLGGLPGWAPVAGCALLPLAALLSADRYLSLGHAESGGFLVGRWGSLVRRRWMLANSGIIGWNIRRSFFQRRTGLVTLTATTAGGRQGYQIQDITMNEAIVTGESAIPGLLRPFVVD
ncbi:MAG TPA: PH domain-containing protein [Mycobacteriales bacterium]|nr:PH domain-containing protein [Mycobacteriales bacterium]